MKIIQGHDYYDGAGLGVDETIVFVRKAQEYTDTPFDLPGGTFGHGDRAGLRFLLVLLGGDVYPAIMEMHRGGFGTRRNRAGEPIYQESRTEYHYDLETALAARQRLIDKGILKERVFWRRNLENDITRHFRERDNDIWTKWMIENKISTGTVLRKDRKTVCTANVSDLKDIEFFRCVDPATAHMRIANWIGGVLPSGPETLEIDDKHRIKKAGFDDSSFRRPKGVKKPRRKKKA
jgi:hypothetical protein